MRHGIVEESRDGRRTIVLVSPVLEAAFAVEAGMICCSLDHQGAELLGQRGGVASWVEKGSTMGIPLLHPWANRVDSDAFGVRKRDQHGLPIHGLLGATPDWQLEAAERHDDHARVRARIEVELDAFPRHELVLEARLTGAELSIETELRADEPAAIAFGWHPYLTLPGVPREQWNVELPVRRQAVLDERGLPTGETHAVEPFAGALGDRGFDDLFLELDDAPFAVEGGGRRLEVSFDEGYPVAQVYAPPGEQFICFEPMTAPTNALVTGDGLRRESSFTSRFSVALR